MGSINFNPFNNNWFNKPSTPFQPINLLTHFNSLKTQQNSPPFAAISNPFSRKPKKTAPEQPGHYRRMLDQFYWECETRPDLRHAPEVEKILNEDPIFEKKENPTQEEIEENDKWWAEFKESPVVQFLAQAEEIADKLNELELKENSAPFRSEDKKLWQAVPNVIGLDGRPIPRKAIKTKKESNDKFWDFAKQFYFGLWGFRQRPYPPGKPIDAAQAIGYKKLEKRYYDFIMRSGGWFYKDRLGRSRGPMELIQLKTAWGAGIIDKHTFIWGEDMDEWAPIGMVYGLEKAIATWEVRLGAAATAFLHKLQKGIPPWVPLKGHEPKTYKQMQEEAYESKRRDLAVLEANDGVWPGVRTPSHALFLWASGSELTSILEADHMPNKYIPKDLRKELEKVIPGLRPWEVLSVEQAMDQITYGGEWYREPLGTYTTGPPYIADWNKDVMRLFEIFHDLSVQVYNKMERTVPGFRKVMENVEIDSAARETKREQKRAAQKRAEEEIALFGRVRSDDE
ncbi:PREDICTED: protein TIC 56, chloroplastic [Nicotiana attenuata]|uniref:Protein tic 56, chloroplastic n=1 Tax=Nicotiana attenuata TaxID=49451 RepID=A0A314KQC8_NICAT|nr:PREDICTED: protein TIC 56, chloroplastic [Nicotiana attenuata]OIT31367.1 protein tic 56, chloroplastic [Nicotiana attenuata]